MYVRWHAAARGTFTCAGVDAFIPLFDKDPCTNGCAPAPTACSDGSANGRLYRRAEDVDKFMNDLAAAASGSSAARQEAS
eukprot:6179949-Pleurochrysis_carterae.AAC.2